MVSNNRDNPSPNYPGLSPIVLTSSTNRFGMRIANSSRGGKTTLGASCLDLPSADKVAGRQSNFLRKKHQFGSLTGDDFLHAACNATSVFFVCFCFFV